MSDVFRRLQGHFQSKADEMEATYNASKLHANNADVGQIREDIVKQFLERYLPNRCEVVRGGTIFDLKGDESKQIDLMVINDLALRFKEQDKSVANIESCYSVISVKSVLDKKQLHEAMDNIASVPLMPDLRDKVYPFMSNRDAYREFPRSIIFAFDGINSDTLCDHLMVKVDQLLHGGVPACRLPDIVYVNNRLLLGRRVEMSSDGVMTIRYAKQVNEDHHNIGARGLLYILLTIQRASNFGPYIFHDFESYLARTFE